MGIVERIKQLMHDNEMNAATFADTIGVQRSSISHILSERNKPSLDFILKILNAYPSVSSAWLLRGIETDDNVFSPDNQSFLPTAFQEEVKTTEVPVPKNAPKEDIIAKSTTKKQVERIIVCYKDGTSKAYLNEN